MIFHDVAPLILVVFLGLILEKTKFLKKTLVDITIDVIYRTTLPILVIWGIIRNADSLLFIRTYWGALLLAPLILLSIVYFFQFFGKKLYFHQKIDLRVIVKIIIPLGLSLVNLMHDVRFMGNICVLSFVIVPFLDLALNSKISACSAKMRVKGIICHPVAIAGLFGLFFLNDNNLLTLVLIKTTGFIVPVILPLCLLIIGAKFGQCNIQKTFKNLLTK